jgi:cell division septum initiation protein DivIVA
VRTEIHSAAKLKFTADTRLAAAAGGVARYLADTAGMESDAAAKLQSETLQACRAAIAQLADSSAQLSVEVTRFADRIEIEVAQQGGEARTRITKYLAQTSSASS